MTFFQTFLAFYAAMFAWGITLEIIHILMGLWARRKYNQQMAALQGQMGGVMPPNFNGGMLPGQPVGLPTPTGTGQYL
jgi:hypothetical protein